MKSEWLVADATPVTSPDRAERDIFFVILGIFWPIQEFFVVGEPFFDTELPS